MPTTTPPDILDVELAGIDALDVPIAAAPSRARRIWSAAWPKLLATAILIYSLGFAAAIAPFIFLTTGMRREQLTSAYPAAARILPLGNNVAVW